MLNWLHIPSLFAPMGFAPASTLSAQLSPRTATVRTDYCGWSDFNAHSGRLLDDARSSSHTDYFFSAGIAAAQIFSDQITLMRPASGQIQRPDDFVSDRRLPAGCVTLHTPARRNGSSCAPTREARPIPLWRRQNGAPVRCRLRLPDDQVCWMSEEDLLFVVVACGCY